MYAIKITGKVGGLVFFELPTGNTIVGLKLRRIDPGTAIVDFASSTHGMNNVAILAIEAPRESSSTLLVELDWSGLTNPPTIDPTPSSPEILTHHDPTTKKSTLTFPVPACAETWHIWDDLNTGLPSFDLKVKVKRK